MGDVTLNAISCNEYKERNPKKATNSTEVTISVVFSMYSYDFMKSHTGWESANFDTYNQKYVFRRFVSELRWSSKSKVIHDPNEITWENIPENNVEVQYSNLQSDYFTHYIFIDCSSIFKENKCEIDWDNMTGYLSFAISEVKDSLFRAHLHNYYGTVNFVVTGYHPLQPITEAFCALVGHPVKDPEYDFSGFIQTMKKDCWFGNFSDWLKKYDWTPQLAECAVFNGDFYGGSEETEFYRASKEIKKIDKELAKLKPYWTGASGRTAFPDNWIIDWKNNGGASTDLHAKGPLKPIYRFHYDVTGEGMTSVWNIIDGDEEPLGVVDGEYYTYSELKVLRNEYVTLSLTNPDEKEKIKVINEELAKLEPYWKEGNGFFGRVACPDKWIIEWKNNGGASTDLNAKGKDKPIYRYSLTDDGDGMTNALYVNSDEEPVAILDGVYYTYAELIALRNEYEEIRKSDPFGPKWWIGPAPRNGQAMSSEKIAEEMANYQQRDFDIWKAGTYEPKIQEYDEYIQMLDSRQKGSKEYDAKEEEVWERKSVEDEDVSNRWSAGINEIAYHGKMVDRSYLVNKKQELQDEYQKRLNSIKGLRDYAALISALKFISAVQFALGFVSLGATSVLAAGSLLVIDSLLEITKMGFEVKYKADYTWDKAIEDHMGSFLNNMVSALLLHSNFAKFTEKDVKAVNSLKPDSMPLRPKPVAPADTQYRAPSSTQQMADNYNYYNKYVSSNNPSSKPLISTDTQYSPKSPTQSMSEQYSSYNASTNFSSATESVSKEMTSGASEAGKAKKKDSIVTIAGKKFDQLGEWVGDAKGALRHKKDKIHRFTVDKIYNSAVREVNGDDLKYFLRPKIGRAVKEASFLYTADSMYNTYMFVFNPTQFKVSDAVALGITEVDDVKVDEIFLNEK